MRATAPTARASVYTGTCIPAQRHAHPLPPQRPQPAIANRSEGSGLRTKAVLTAKRTDRSVKKSAFVLLLSY